MPRYRRQTAFGSVQHIISRFVDREFRFDQPNARAEYLRRVSAAVARTDWKVIAYAFMSSHVHWALRAGSKPSADFIKPLHTGFAGWLNAAQGRLGPVFADRHRTVTCEGTSAAALLAYIHNNPVRAGIVADPADSPWTSHRAYLGLEPAPRWLDIELGLDLCGFSVTTAGRRAFRAFVLARAREPRSIALSGGDLQRRRREVRAALAGPVEIEAPSVVPHLDALELQTRVIVPAGCYFRSPDECTTDRVLATTALACGIAVQEIRSRNRKSHFVRARRIALLMWVAHLGRPTVQMARALGIAGSSAAELMATASPGVRREAAELARRLSGSARAHNGAFSV